MVLPEPFDRIRRCVGHRSLPEDWPRLYDLWDAFDQDGEFLVTLDYTGLSQLLQPGVPRSGDIVLDWEDDPEHARRVVVTPNTSLDLTLRVDFGDGIVIENPQRLVPKAEIGRALEALHRKP